MDRRRIIATIQAIASIALIVPGCSESADFQPIRVVHPAAAITDFPLVSASKADRELTDAELVLGVTVDGESRAYPINMLTGPSREILNDTLEGQAIAATW